MNSTISRLNARLRATSDDRLRRTAVFRPIALLIGLALLCNSPRMSAGQLAAPAISVAASAHFLEQATFGPTQDDVALVTGMGPEVWLDQQFALAPAPITDNTDGNKVRNELFLNMANAPDQLRQRMMFALSQIIVVSSNKTGSGGEMVPWIRLLSTHAFGNYRQLLKAVSLSPTMGKYLDGAYSRKESARSSPNENFPRELLQLFTIGLWELNQDGTLRLNGQGQPIPSYTQDTVREIARALTGWTFPPKPGQPSGNSNPQYFASDMVPGLTDPTKTTHDYGEKVIFGARLPAGQTHMQDLDSVIDIIFEHPNLGPFVATRLIRSLVTSNPSPAYVQRVATAFNNTNGERGNLRAVLRAILLDPEAASFASEDGRLKDPILHILGLGRALGVAFANPDGFNYVFSNLTERVLSPQTVFSFFSPLAPLPGSNELFGPEFQIYPPALAIQRANFIYGLLNNQFSSSFPFPAAALVPFTSVAGDQNVLVELVNQKLMFGRMTPELKALIIAATVAVPVTDPRQRAIGALYLAAISSEYSVFSNSVGVAAPTVQPPTGLTATSIVGNRVTLRWTPPLFGPPPTAYVMEGGIAPGQVIASLPGGASPSMTFTAPPGAFYVRIRSLSGATRSRASSEIRIYVNVATGPTAPRNLQGVVSGTSLGLSWRNTFGGGAATSMLLDVTGALSASLPLPLSETFTFPNVPPGQYTFSVRAVNAAGSSGSSNPLTLTFPTACSGAPQAPTNFSITKFGNFLSLEWQPSTSGPAALSYELDVRGSFTGTVPVTSKSFTAPVPPGRYEIRVRAVNPCGRGSTPRQTVTVP